jgi:hypothetical protein
VQWTVDLKRPRNAEMRTREYLLPEEIEALLDAAKANRYGHRDATMVLTAYRRWRRYAIIAGLSRSLQHPKHGALHRDDRYTV